MKRRTLLLCLPLLACSPLALSGEPRIAALSWEPAEHLLQLGITPLTVADAPDYRDWVVRPTLPADVVNAGSRTEPNLERLAQLRPELILITPLLEDIRAPLERIAPVLSYGDFTQKQDNLELQRSNYLDLAARLQRSDLANRRLRQMQQRIDALRQQLLVHFAGELPKVTLIRFASATQVYIFGPNSLPQHAMTLLGLQPAQAVPVSRWGSTQAPVTQLGGIEDGVVIYIEPFAQHERLFTTRLWQAMPFVRQQRLTSMRATWTHGGVFSVQYLAQAISEALLKLPAE
ncbi:ABC transporter substrate-binding protein [Ectopseudomonas khazarica]|uniref:ABC transporter substrate-binding protein n=1 Tax=Ectopseudomonas khazarica TaxID=2502979 RepID=UPI003850B804